jgi:lysophospholipase L1-like esterase
MTHRFLALASILAALATAPAHGESVHWIGTWATAAQPAMPERVETLRNQSVRLIAHISTGGKSLRIRLSNTHGDRPLEIGNAHIARRARDAEIIPASDRALKFRGMSSISVPAGAEAVSDPVELEVPALSDLAISIYFPEAVRATTTHALAMQTNYVSAETGDATAAVKFPVGKTISSWPFLTGVDVAAMPEAASIVAFGSSLTDGDGTTEDVNRRWPDVLAERLQKASGRAALFGVMNEGIIGNRLLYDSPKSAANPFGPMLGESGLARFDRDVLARPGVKYVLVCLGVNDILFPAFPFTPPTELVTAEDIVTGYRKLIARGHQKGIRVIGTTIPPFEGAKFDELELSTPGREKTRMAVNAWIRSSGEFDAVVDFDRAVRDPDRPARLLPAFDSGDHLHPNDAGSVAQANIIPLELFR